jgi:nitrate/TMAO reductase-like tetraheme cytochrome c subunit
MKKILILVITFCISVTIFGCTDSSLNDPENNIENEKTDISSLELVAKISDEWKSSGHQYAITTTEGRGINCAKCHDGVGFAERLEYADTDFLPQHQTGIDCQACHTGFGKQTIETGLVELPFMDQPFESGSGAVCAACHNGNRDPDGLYAQSEAGELQAYSYPHYGMNAAILTGKGGMEIPGVEYVFSIAHSEIEDSCVTCHMPVTEEGYRLHTFKANLDYFAQTCATCHVDQEPTFNIGGLQDEVKLMLDKLEAAILDAAGAAKIDTGGGVFTYYDANGEEISEVSHEVYVASYNWRLVAKDGSYGVHNPLYAKSLLQESYKLLTGEDL